MQIYYGYRLSLLSGMKIIPMFIAAVWQTTTRAYNWLSENYPFSPMQTALVQGISGVIQGVEAHLASSFTNFGTKVFNNSIAVCIAIPTSHRTLILKAGPSLFFSPQVWLVGSAVCDIIVAISMTIVVSFFCCAFIDSLRHSLFPQLIRIDSRIVQTQAVVSRLIRLVVETGCLTGKHTLSI